MPPWQASARERVLGVLGRVTNVIAGLLDVRLGLLTALFGTDPADAEVATVVRAAINQTKGQGAEVVEVTIPGLNELIQDRMRGFLVLAQDFKFDLNAYLAARPSAPVRTLEAVLASGKFHPAVETPRQGPSALRPAAPVRGA